jgi:hypothetical protein
MSSDILIMKMKTSTLKYIEKHEWIYTDRYGLYSVSDDPVNKKTFR